MRIRGPDVLEPGEDESLDVLTERWKIFQLRKGHRFSSDDVLTAWTAWKFKPDGTRCLDLGCGIGTVGLLTLYKMPSTAQLLSVEVQEISYSLAVRTVRYNGLEGRVQVVHSDLRDHDNWASNTRYDQVTGSPPYFPLGTALVSPHPQRAGARMELKGDVHDYCKAAASVLAEDGVLSLCHAAGDPRPEAALEAVGLRVLSKRDVVFREGKRPTISLYAAAWSGDRKDEPDFVLRDEKGRWTQECLSMRREMGIPDLSVPLSEVPPVG